MDGKKELIGFKDKRILIVEKYYANAELNRLYLVYEGINNENIVVVENMLVAIQKAEHEIFDVIIMGIDMPGDKGIEATKEIKLYYVDGIGPQIIAYTMNPDIENINEYKKNFDDVMIQPIKRILFVHKIFDMLTKQNAKTQRA